ncbi:MAG: hypothetical protein A2328_11620 [Bdellovibrionales bacterium RIFOXYB2_FULL_36_6]|nr:MAG: hypothetical protein A2328_11620 [Bdellovibrionales bacterium RIFOXYB2_FULL_36_6]
MKDKIVPFFEGFLKGKRFRVKRLRDEIFGIKDKVFISNSKPDIVNNLSFCIQRNLTRKGFWQ